VDGTGYLNGFDSLWIPGSFCGFYVTCRAEIPKDAPVDENSAGSVVLGALHARFFIFMQE
jgi:hypothetical protein